MLIGYGVVAFAVLQIVEPIQHALGMSDSVLKLVVVLLGLGFPIALVLAWAFDVGAGGIERTAPLAGAPSRSARTLLLLALAGILIAAPGIAWVFLGRSAAAPNQATAAAELKAKLDAVPPASDIRAPPSIAVLPFVNLSSDKEQDYFSDGLTEEILNALAQVDGLQVAGRTSSFSFKGKNEDLRSIGKQLGVSNVLEGSVRKAGDRVRITTQVITVADGFHSWSQTFDRSLTDIFAVQEEIARAVASVLRVKLLPGRQAIPNARRTANPEVYTQYLIGKALMAAQTHDGYRQAVEAFEKALALDPAYAPAHAGLSEALGWWSNSDPDGKMDRVAIQQRATAEAEKAVALAPELADSWLARGRDRLGFTWDWAGARADLEKGLSIAPGDSDLQRWRGHLLAVQGHLAEAIAATRKLVESDPLSAWAWDYLGRYFAATGNLAESRSAFARSLQIAPASIWTNREFAFTYLLGHDPAGALAAFEKQQGWVRLLGLALAHHDLGHAAQAKAALEELIAQPDQPCYQIAQVYGWWGDKDRAFEWLERARTTRDPGIRYVKYDPLLQKLRTDARYPALLQRLNLPVD